MKVFKKALALLLALAMVITSLTVTTFAEDPEGTGVSTEVELYDAWKAGGKIWLKNDITIGVDANCWLNSKPTSSTDLDLNFHGHKIIGSGESFRLCNTKNSNKTTKFWSDTGYGTLTGLVYTTDYIIYQNLYSKFYMENIIVDGCKAKNSIVWMASGGSSTSSTYTNVIFQNNTLTSSQYAVIGQGASTHYTYSTTLDNVKFLNNTTKVGRDVVISSPDRSTYSGAKNTLTIKGDCVFEQKIVVNENATATITGGSFNSDTLSLESGYSYAKATFPAYEKAPYTVVADTDTFKLSFVDTESETTTAGDSFPVDATPLCKDGYVLPTPVKAGFSFVGWNSEEDGNGTSFAPGDKIVGVKNEEVTLYAIWGDEPTPVATVTVDDITTEYYTFDEVVEAVNGVTSKSGSSIVLLDDVTGAFGTLDQKMPIKLDLNGYTITCGANQFALLTKTKLTIQDSSDPSTGKIVGPSTGTTPSTGFIGVNNSGAVLTVDGGTIEANATTAVIFERYSASANFVMNGGTITNKKSDGVAVRVNPGSSTYIYRPKATLNAGTINGKVEVNISSEFNIDGVTINGDVTIATATPSGSEGVLNIISGTINGDLTASKGETTMTGGTITGTIKSTTEKSFTIEGGNVGAIDSDTTNLSITGGTFHTDPSDYLQEGYIAVPDSTEAPTLWTVEKGVFVAKTIISGDTKYYETIEGAWASANVAGQEATIALLDDVTLDNTLTTVADKITLDLNGYTLQDLAESTARILVVSAGSEFDVTSSVAGGQLVSNAAPGDVDAAILVMGTFKVLGGTVKTSSLSESAWSNEDVITTAGDDALVVIDGGAVATACPTKPAIGLNGGKVSFVEGTITGGIINHDDAYDIEGDMAVKTQFVDSNDATYFATFASAKEYAVAATLDGYEMNFTMLADYTTSSRINFYTGSSWSESAARTIYFDFNGHKIIAAKASTTIFGINGSDDGDAGILVISDSVGTGGVEGNNSTLFYSSGWALNYRIYGGNYTGVGSIGTKSATPKRVKIYGGTYDIDPTTYVASTDYKAVDNGDNTWTVKEKEYVISINIDGETIDYEYIGEAIDAILATDAKAGTISVAKDFVLDDTLILDDADASIIFDLCGHSVKPAEGKSFADVKAGSLIVLDGSIDFTGADETARIQLAKDVLLEFNNVNFEGAEIFIESKGVVVVDGEVVTDGIVLQEESAVSFYSISASISDDVKFSFVVNAALIEAEEGAEVKLQYTVDTYVDGEAGRETIVIDPRDTTDGQYTFDFAKGLPQWSVNSDLELNILVNGESKLTKAYTLQDYYNTLNAYFPEETLLNTLMANQIKFAEELQKKAFGSSTIEYAGWEDEFISVAEPTEEDNVKASVDITGYKKDVSQIAGATVNVTDKIALTYKTYSETDHSTLTVVNESGEEVELSDKTVRNSTPEKPWYVYQSKISPLDYDETYTVVLRNEKGDMIHAIKYSVNSYCYSMVNDGKQSGQTKDVAMALYRYGVAAAKFTEETDPSAEHHFGEVTYEWSPYYAECTATRKCLDKGCELVETETATAVRTEGVDVEGVRDQEYVMTARFANPAFRTQVHVCAPDPKALTPKDQQTAKVVYAKHLITDDSGNYGGSLDESTYGKGAPLNGENDIPDSPYYAINDFYNLTSNANRTMLYHFAPYQQTMQYSDGLACLVMALNYMGKDVAGEYTEKNLVDKYEEINGTTVYGNGTTAEGLANLLESEKIEAKANDFSGDDFYEWVKSNLEAGNIPMTYFHKDRQERWLAIIGYDDLGTPDVTNDDVVIFADPFDAFDHYQDGYAFDSRAKTTSWMCAVDLAGNTTRKNETLVIVPENPILPVYDYDNDPMITYPEMGERHLLTNVDGNFGGTYDAAMYGQCVAENGYTMVGDEYVSREHFDYNYYAFPDIYNMENNGNGLHVLSHWESFQQTMKSSCGISSTLNTLNYLGYDLTELADHIHDLAVEFEDQKDLMKKPSDYDRIANFGEIDPEDHSKMQEAIVMLYALGDTNFTTEAGKYLDRYGLSHFNNYGGVGAGNLSKVPTLIGYENVEIGRYYRNNFKEKNVPFPTYDKFLEFVIENIDNEQPIIFCGPNHWRVMIGIDTMGTDTPYDDIIFLGDSSDKWDHFQNGIDTEPAMTFYARWYNGGRSTNQQYILVK